MQISAPYDDDDDDDDDGDDDDDDDDDDVSDLITVGTFIFKSRQENTALFPPRHTRSFFFLLLIWCIVS